MMKWKTRKETTNIGVLELGNLTFNENSLEISLEILDMSADLQSEVNKAIEIEKVNYIEKWEETYDENPKLDRFTWAWSDKPVERYFTCLRIALEEGKPVTYVIQAFFEDAENENIFSCAEVIVDLSAHADELKKMVIHALVDRFF